MTTEGRQYQRDDHSLTVQVQKGRTHIKLYLLLLLTSMAVCFSLSLTGNASRDWSPLTLEKRSDLSRMEEKLFFDEYAKIFHVLNVTCANLFAGSESEIADGRRVATQMKKELPLLSNDFFIRGATNCEKFTRSRGYITSYLTPKERDFPIAFSILVYKDAEMVDRLLRAIYRPQNVYCVHADGKADAKFLQAIDAIASCFHNVFVPSRRINVVWGKLSVLEPELMCMEELLSRNRKWKYFINLTGQEFPLKTNAELVKILTAYDGANDVHRTRHKRGWRRLKGKRPPNGVRFSLGSVHICVNRKFVDYVIHNDTTHRVLDWVSGTRVPDETFFSSLNHSPQLGIPGSYKGYPRSTRSHKKPYLTRFKNWGYPCAGDMSRGICILSTGDLPLLSDRPEMFANKFLLKADRIVVGCLEEKHFNDTRDEYFGRKSFNSTFYQTLSFVKDKIPVWTAEDE